MFMASRLYLHKGALRAKRSDLVLVETPESTATWKPVCHIQAVEVILEQAETVGLTLHREQYGLSKEGQQLFGVMDFHRKMDNYGYAIGFNNSHNKTLALNIVAGSRVFVCDNLALSGDFRIHRKHTAKADVRYIVADAFAEMPSRIENLFGRMDELKTLPISDDQARKMIFDAAEVGAIASCDMIPVWEEFIDPSFEEFTERNQFNLLMSFTHLVKKFSSPVKLEKAYRKLAPVFGI